jgi:hypothetical protein
MLRFERVREDGEAPAELREFRRPVIPVGRSSSQLFRIEHTVVSGRHGQLRWDGECWMYRDESLNGTWRNGEKLTPKCWVGPLRLGDTFGFGAPSVCWRLINVPTRPDDEATQHTRETGTLVADDLWPALQDLRVEATRSEDRQALAIAIVLMRGGAVVQRCALDGQTQKQRLLISLLAEASARASGSSDREGWLPRRALAKAMGYGAADPNRKVNGRVAGLQRRLERLGLRQEAARGFIECQKRGTQSFYRLAVPIDWVTE